MQGKVVGTSLVIMDSFALPVQGTETRVNAANEANEYMVQYIASCERVRRPGTFVGRSCADDHRFTIQVGRLENAIGWYHSHPGYGCWLSGIDVTTQMTNQQYQDPFVAVVVRASLPTLKRRPVGLQMCRSTLIGPFLLGRWISALSERTQRAISHRRLASQRTTNRFHCRK